MYDCVNIGSLVVVVVDASGFGSIAFAINQLYCPEVSEQLNIFPFIKKNILTTERN